VRNSRFIFIISGALIVAAAVLATSILARSAGGERVSTAPNFVLESLDGSEVSLRDYRGNVVLVNFWATWCPPCQKEIPALEAAYRANKDKGFVILGVDVGESRQAVEAYAASMNITYPLLLDEEDQWMSRYGALGLPMTVIIDREGKILQKHMGELTQDELTGILEEYIPGP
jgi:peroxiredoxin